LENTVKVENVAKRKFIIPLLLVNTLVTIWTPEVFEPLEVHGWL
jgi:hypothetical protein